MDSKDSVKAQREAKKLEKQAKKRSDSGNPTVTPSKENTSVNNLSGAQLNKSMTQKTDSLTSKSAESKTKPTVQTMLPTPIQTEIQGTGENSETGKTREEIKAEREAKKLAKQAAKNKKKTVDDVNTKDIPKAVVEPKVEPASGNGLGEKSKAQLRAERRALQEAQRAAKETKSKVDNKAPPTSAPSQPNKEEIKKDSGKLPSKQPPPQAKPAATMYQPKLLSHLQMDTRPLPSHIYLNVHPAIVELGAKYAARVVSGSNARCIALLQALKSVIVDFITPREKEFSRAMETRLNDSVAYLNASRQSSVSMTNALKHVKSHLTQLTTENTTDDEARRKLCEVIDTFIKEQIDVAGEAIRNAIAMKISDGDTIAIYGCSSLLYRILVECRRDGKNFQVVVVDGGPLYEGREMCRRLVAENIKCSYVLLPAFSFSVAQTTKVLLGAHALLANGCVMSRSGSALVAMVAKAHNVPVIVCCETYKFSERVQADAFVHNELGPQFPVTTPPTISLMYDVTPPAFVDAVATELAILPCTSVPVILRVKPSDVGYY